jgi:hypothetical protein
LIGLPLLDATLTLFFGVRRLDPEGSKGKSAPADDYPGFVTAVALSELELQGQVRSTIAQRKSAPRTTNLLSVELSDSSVRHDRFDRLIAAVDAGNGQPSTLEDITSLAGTSIAELRRRGWERLVADGWIVESSGDNHQPFELAEPAQLAVIRRAVIQMTADSGELTDRKRALVALLAARGGVVEGSGYVWSPAPGVKQAVRALQGAMEAEGQQPLEKDRLGRAADSARSVMDQLPVARVACEEGLRRRRRAKLRKGADAAARSPY